MICFVKRQSLTVSNDPSCGDDTTPDDDDDDASIAGELLPLSFRCHQRRRSIRRRRRNSSTTLTTTTRQAALEMMTGVVVRMGRHRARHHHFRRGPSFLAGLVVLLVAIRSVGALARGVLRCDAERRSSADDHPPSTKRGTRIFYALFEYSAVVKLGHV